MVIFFSVLTSNQQRQLYYVILKSGPDLIVGSLFATLWSFYVSATQREAGWCY